MTNEMHLVPPPRVARLVLVTPDGAVVGSLAPVPVCQSARNIDPFIGVQYWL